MGSGMKESKKYTMGLYNPTPEQLEAQMWCIDNGIQISPYGVHGKNEWYVDINLGKGWRRSPKTYKKVEIWEVVFNYYSYYYNKKHEASKERD